MLNVSNRGDARMESLVLLGQIPGTSIHINFASWLVVAIIVSIAALLRYDHQHRRRLWFGALQLSLWYSGRRQAKYFDQIAL